MTKNFQRLGFQQVNGKPDCPTQGTWWIFKENTKTFQSTKVCFRNQEF